MAAHRDFNAFFGEAMERSALAEGAVRARHADRPFQGRAEIRAAFKRELSCMEAGAFSVSDELELKQLGISL